MAHVAVEVSSGATPVARVALIVSAGDGPEFTQIVADLQQSGSSSSWSTFVTGIPAGAGRQFTVVALDAGSHALRSGSGKSDIFPGETATISIILHVPEMPHENSVPVADYVSTPPSSVAPGSTLSLQAAAHDPDGDTLSYLWSASCGSFDVTSSPNVVWTAPSTDPTTCELKVTVTDGEGASTETSITIAVTSARTITGTRLVTYWPDLPTPKVTIPAPEVATATAPSAFVHDASGSWKAYAGGSVRPDGTFAEGQFGVGGAFAIPGVPAGTYVLCYGVPSGGQGCTDTSADQVDLGYDVLGRADQAPPTRATPVTLELTGLDPWNPSTDQIQITSSNADLWDVAGRAGVFQGGDTSGKLVEDFEDGNGSGAPLDLLGQADVLYVHQLSARSIYAANTILLYTAATHATAQPPVSLALTDGQSASIQAALTQLQLSASIDLDWDLPKFEAYLAALGPPARTSVGAKAHTFRVGADAFPLGWPAPASAGSPELVRFELPAGVGEVSGTLSYGRFLPQLWEEWQDASFTVQVSYLGPGATLPILESAAVERRDPLPVATGAVAPAVSPALAPKINGSDAFHDSTGVGVTPTLSWSPPTVGAPTAYVVEVYRLGTAGAATTSSVALRYVTQATTVTVPPGVLDVGATYYARIAAEVSTAPYALAPFRRANVHARATLLTGTFSP